jgi:hypothetical protein
MACGSQHCMTAFWAQPLLFYQRRINAHWGGAVLAQSIVVRF